jgi:hypothetical protein
MSRTTGEHNWELIEQAYPPISKPFGFVCCCGEGAVGSYTSAKEAIRAARSHFGTSSQDARAA